MEQQNIFADTRHRQYVSSELQTVPCNIYFSDSPNGISLQYCLDNYILDSPVGISVKYCLDN